jgi:hypothetical protein
VCDLDEDILDVNIRIRYGCDELIVLVFVAADAAAMPAALVFGGRGHPPRAGRALACLVAANNRYKHIAVAWHSAAQSSLLLFDDVVCLWTVSTCC